MIRTLQALLLAAAFLSAQTPAPVTAEVATDAARCGVIATTSACLHYTAPATPDVAGVFEPGTASLRISGPASLPVTVQAVAISPVGRPWLGVRGIGATDSSSSVSGVLPLDIEVYADESQLAEVKAGRFVAVLTVTAAGITSVLKVPVELTVTAPTDALRADPDTIPDLELTASPGMPASRFTINVSRNEVDPPLYVSVTPETSDGGTWLAADLRFSSGQCADQPAPCSFNVVVQPPARAGIYWGALVITGDGFAERVSVRVTVNAAPQMTPVTIEPRKISLSAPLGSRYAVSTVVNVSGGNRDGVQFRVAYTDPWLSVDPPAATWPTPLRLVMSPAGLDAGVYTDVIVLRAVDTNEVLASIPVRFNVIAPSYAPSVLDGAGWRTRFYLVNPSPLEARATISFWSGAGSPWLVGVENKGLVTRVESEVIPPGGLRVIETQGAQSRTQQGWAELTADGPVAMHAVLAQSKQVSKWLPVDATVPMMNPYQDHLLLTFDNLDGASSSISLANSEDEQVTVNVSVLNENGAEIAQEGKFTLAGREGATYSLAGNWPSTAERRGLISLSFDGGRLFATGLRALSKGFYSYPAIACSEMGVDRGLPMVNAGGTWQSTAYLTNSTSLGQLGLLRLWPDKSRFSGQILSDESAPVVPANGMLMWQAPCKDTTRAAGGWLESRYSKQVNGFMLLRQSYTGTPADGAVTERYEAAQGGQRSVSGRLAIPYDNRESNATQIVLVNPNDHPVDIQTVMYDMAGRFPRYADSFRLPARGQLAVNSADRWDLGLPQGILEFSTRQGLPLTGAGLRYSDGALAILPAYEK